MQVRQRVLAKTVLRPVSVACVTNLTIVEARRRMIAWTTACSLQSFLTGVKIGGRVREPTLYQQSSRALCHDIEVFGIKHTVEVHVASKNW